MNKTKKILVSFFTLLLLFCQLTYSNTKSEVKVQPKYIFYFIGDGFGITQATAAEKYINAVQGKSGLAKLTLNTLPNIGFFTTNAQDRFITGSAAAGTALATGHKTSINTIGMTADRQFSLLTMAELARDKGMKVGIVTSVSIDHATPAAFYAHQHTRNMYYEISLDLSKSGFNYFAGGGFLHPEGDGDKKVKNSKQNMGISQKITNRNPKENSYKVALNRGYTITKTKEDFEKLKKSDDKIIALAPKELGGAEIRYVIDQTDKDITLQDFTRKGIELLDNDKGFFMMVEGGKIDWACHANDAATVIDEVLQFDNAVKVAMEFYKKHPKETLIVVLGDHETGGMGMGFAGTHYQSSYNLLKYQNISGQQFSSVLKKYKKLNKDNLQFEVVLDLVKYYFGLGDTLLNKSLALSKFEIQKLKDAYQQSIKIKSKSKKSDQYYLLYGSYEPVTITACHILAQKAGIGWTSYSHTATPLPIRAIGQGSKVFAGYQDNTDIAKHIFNLMGSKVK